MMKKRILPTREQQTHIKAAELNPLFWVVTRDMPENLIVYNRITGEFRTIQKNGGKV